MKIKNIPEIITIASIMIVLFLASITPNNIINKEVKVSYEYESCKDKGIEETTQCLIDYIKPFYNYTVRNELLYTNNQGSIEDIKKYGGDCYDYSKIMVNISKSLGYLAKLVQINSNEVDEGHTFSVIWDKNISNYCVVDQIKLLGCVELQ